MDQKLEKNRNANGKVHETINRQKKDNAVNLDVVLDLLLATIMAFQLIILLFMVCEMMGFFKQAPGLESPLNDACPLDPLAKHQVKSIGMELYLLICSIQFMGTAILFKKRFMMCRGKPKPNQLVRTLFLFMIPDSLYDRIAKKLRESKKRIPATDDQAKAEFLKNNP